MTTVSKYLNYSVDSELKVIIYISDYILLCNLINEEKMIFKLVNIK